MKTFAYRAKNEKRPEDTIDGTMTAEKPEDVVERLARQGYVATSVRESSSHLSRAKTPLAPKKTRISLRSHSHFARQLSSLLRSGIPILRAFNILSEETSDKHFSRVLAEVGNRIQNGDTLASALSKYPNLFSPFYVSMIRSGEDTGKLVESLDRVSRYYTAQSEFVTKVRSALAYPLLIMIVGILTVIFVFTNVIPKIAPLFTDLGAELPLPTKILLGMSSFVQTYWPVILLVFSIFFVMIFRASREKMFRRYISRIALAIPVLGPFLMKSEFARFSRTLELALNSGVPIISAFRISLDVVRLEILKEDLLRVERGLEGGRLLGELIKGSKLYPRFVFTVISVGEEAGRLEEALGDIATTFEGECEEMVKVATTLIEPVMVLIVGLVVAFIVGAVLLPIFQLNVINL